MSMCSPAIVYAVFVLMQISLDLSSGSFTTAIIKLGVGICIIGLLYLLCTYDLTYVAWIVVIIPFLYTTAIVGVVMFIFGLDVATGKIKYGQGASSSSTAAPPQGTPASTTTTTTTTTAPPKYLAVSKYYDTIVA